MSKRTDTHDIRIKTPIPISATEFLAAFEGCLNRVQLEAMLKTKARIYFDTGGADHPNWERLADGSAGATPAQDAATLRRTARRIQRWVANDRWPA